MEAPNKLLKLLPHITDIVSVARTLAPFYADAVLAVNPNNPQLIDQFFDMVKENLHETLRTDEIVAIIRKKMLNSRKYQARLRRNAALVNEVAVVDENNGSDDDESVPNGGHEDREVDANANDGIGANGNVEAPVLMAVAVDANANDGIDANGNVEAPVLMEVAVAANANDGIGANGNVEANAYGNGEEFLPNIWVTFLTFVVLGFGVVFACVSLVFTPDIYGEWIGNEGIFIDFETLQKLLLLIIIFFAYQ